MINFSHSIKNNKITVIIYCIGILLFIIVGSTPNRDDLHKPSVAQAILAVQRQFGTTPLAPEHEAMVKSLAHEMGITKPIIMRRMNQAALAIFGYHNAVAVNPCVQNIIPIHSASLLFISESFFEDLTAQEQRFILGHELAHIKKGHLQYTRLIMYLLYILLIICACLFYPRSKAYIARIHTTQHAPVCAGVITLMLVCGSLGVGHGTLLAYQRHIEQEADTISLQMFNTYDGCMQLIDRWQKEFALPEHHAYFGLTADHPSCAERRAMCQKLQLQHTTKESLS